MGFFWLLTIALEISCGFSFGIPLKHSLQITWAFLEDSFRIPLAHIWGFYLDFIFDVPWDCLRGSLGIPCGVS